jgi:threonine dehydrogenase-like Zn-dependent dehydrogenase
MKALVYHGPKDLRWEDVPEPKIADDQLLVAMRAVGVCGSDLHGYLGITGRRIPPMIMGHEFSGIVMETGSKVSRFSVGDRICVQPIQFCGTCEFCKAGAQNICPNKKILGVMDINGAMGEMVAVKETNAFVLPDNISFVAGSMVEPFSVAHSAIKQAPPLKNMEVAIIGMGTIGLCILQYVKMNGAKKIYVCDLSETRLNTAAALGADVLVNPKKGDASENVLQQSGGRGVDICFEAVGESVTARESLEMTKIKGQVIWVGNSAKTIEIDMQKVVTTELNIQGIYGFTNETFKETLSILEKGLLHPQQIVSIEKHVSKGAEVFETMLAEKDRYIKAILTNK